MSKSVSQRAAIARKSLHDRYDELNDLWLRAEEQLAKYHIPIEVDCVYRSWDVEGTPWSQGKSLGMRKLGNSKWRICFAHWHEGYPEEDLSWIPIVDCPVEIRVEAAEHLNDLREAIVKSSEQFIPKVDAAIAALKEEILAGDDHLKVMLAERARLNGASN